MSSILAQLTVLDTGYGQLGRLPAGSLIAHISMGNVLEFQSARVQLHLVLLRLLGVPDVFSWRVLGTPRDRLWDGELYASPLLVATRRDGEVFVIDLTSGRTPDDVTDSRAVLASLDAAVVRQYLERRGRACSRISSWLVYEDGGHIEVTARQELLVRLRQRAQRVMRDHELPATSTRDLAALWESLGDRNALGL